MASQGVPKWSKGCPRGPKRNPKTFQGGEKEVERHPKESKKSQNYVHIKKYTQTPDPPPYSGRLVIITILTENEEVCLTTVILAPGASEVGW